MKRIVAIAGVACVLGACAPGSGPAQGEPTPDAVLAGLEARLLDANGFVLRFRASASGAFSAGLEGDLRHAGAGHADLTADGTFGDAPVELRLDALGDIMRGGNSGRSFTEPVPAELTDALVLGFTRMGIMHNLARLSAGQPPDHAAGGVREWVQAVNPHLLPPDPAIPDAVMGIGFGVEVSGERAGEAMLWLDGDGLPLHRTQIVAFPGGEMRVVEEYEFLQFDP